MKKTIKKTFLVTIILLEILALNIYPVQAFSLLGGLLGMPGGVSPNANGMLKQVEERYHLNKKSIQDIGETFNVASQKSKAPEVDLFFNPTSPKFGEKMTATALPKFFQNENKKLYFTWYLKHTDGKNKDLNEDGKINQEDWKIEAMRIIAQNGFIREKANYESDDDNDGYDAQMGKGNNIQQKNRCYVHDFKSGEDYEVAHIKDNIDSPGNDYSRFDCDGTMICSSPYRLSCGGQEGTISVPEQNLGDASSTGGSGGDSGSGGSGGDASVSLTIPEHNETIDYKSITIFDAVTDSEYSPYCKPISESPGKGIATCPEGTTARCITDSRTLNPTCDFIGDMTARVCGTAGAEEGACCSGDLCTRTNPTAFSNPGETGTISCTTQTINDNDIEQSCEHLFPSAHINNTWYDTGDGSFDLNEEKFWGTNPHDPSTANNDNNDEANVAGLGRDKFMWTYLPGDKVGVIVEGTSLSPTKHNDSSSSIMWALPNNIFEKKGDNDCTIHHEHGNKSGGDDGETKYSENIKGYDVEIPFASVNINACLKYNLVDPMKGGQPGNLETELNYYPSNPNKGDILTFSANISNNTTDNSQLYYKWSVYGGDEQSLDMDDWTELSNNADFRNINGIKLLEGLGLDTFDINLNEINNKYIRVFIETEEYYNFGESQDTTRSGKSDVIIKIGSMSDNAMSLQIAGGNDVSNVCSDNGDNCKVLNGQIIEAKLDDSGLRNFSWTLNGKPINYLQEGETTQGNIVRFPIMGNPGDSYVLKVIANDTAGLGESGNAGNKVILTKNVKVVKPSVKLGIINSLDSDSCTASGGLSPLRLGTYNDLNGDTTADCSQSVFVATRNNINVPISYYPANIENSLTDIQWSVNGVKQDNGNIDLSNYPTGSTIIASITARYAPSNRSELSQTWGVSQFETGGKTLSDSIKIRVGTNPQQASGTPTKVIASLIYNLPTQILFLIKIVLTVAIIIFASGIIMSFDRKR